MRDKIKEIEEKKINNLALNSLENKLDIIKLDHDPNKIALNLIIVGIKEEKDKDT
jgi:hypothetical protein